MKKLLCLTLLLCLTGCIQVKNWGCYEQNFSHDEQLHGTWLEATASSGHRTFEIWPYLNGYILVPVKAQKKADANDNSDFFRTIRFGGYDFMLIGGLLYRYEIVGDKMSLLEVDTESHFEEIRKIVVLAETVKLEKIKSELIQSTYTTLEIERMDAAAAEALVELAARPDLWKQTGSARRLGD